MFLIEKGGWQARLASHSHKVGRWRWIRISGRTDVLSRFSAALSGGEGKRRGFDVPASNPKLTELPVSRYLQTQSSRFAGEKGDVVVREVGR